ncbi:WD repeat-containing protein 6 [Pygocentrus nattereri]|uniref:tRNA (34-2'-O)-methyltransferase regulator WDR6 n=1 Tax=Pygocentrus nattereri TaxID=42514 RepID=A0A3B4E4S6_PYGNA|nr:WD repeat-containing protein 6 [Pygocentrus nattereri]
MPQLNSTAVLESSALVAPVTALEFLGDDYLLTGEGPVLSIFSLRASPKQCMSLNVLHNYRIHGIRPKGQNKSDGNVPETPTRDDDVKLVVFGGKCLRLINVRTCGSGLEVAGPLMELQDWVLDVCWLKPGEANPLLGVTLAHNAALLLEPQSGKALTRSSCVEVCLLYSALLIGPSWETSVLVGGTVFNQLVLWRPGGAGANSQAQVERRLLGHKGVIFSLCYLQSSGWLASASDDRSVRVWHVGRVGGDGGCGEESPTCLRVLYGHQARVFCVRLSPGQVYSAGEDGACLLWEWEGDGRVGRMLKGHRSGGIRALAVSKGSVGEGSRWVATGGADGGVRLWNVIDQSSETTALENQKDLGFRGRGSPKVVRSVGGHDSVLVCTDQGEVFLHQDGLWEAIWNGGPEFRSYCIMEVAYIQLQNSSTDKGLWVCALGNLNGGVQVFPLNHSGAGLFLQAGEGKIHSLQWVEGCGVWGFSWCLLVSGSEGLVYRWMVQVEEDETGPVLMMEKMKPFMLPPCAKRWLTAAVVMPSGKDASWVCGDRRGSLLLYREMVKGIQVEEKIDEERADGNIRLENNMNDVSIPISPISTLFGIHGKRGVTSVSEHQGVFYSTGRDGCVRVLTVKGDSLNVRRIQRACKGMEWLEKVLFLDSDGLHHEKHKTNDEESEKQEERLAESMPEDGQVEREESDGGKDTLTEEAKVKEKWPESKQNGDTARESVSEASFIMVGFHSIQFVLWDPLRREKLFSAACGGGHRSWAYICPSNVQTHLSNHTVGQGTLIFIKQGAVMASHSLTSSATEVRGHILREGLHGRGLSCVHHLGSVSKPGVSSEAWEVLIIGGEDTTVTVLAIKPEQDIVKVLAVIADHISNVRTLAAVPGGATEDQKSDRWTDPSSSFSTLVFSAGGRAQLQCCHLLIGWEEQFNWPGCQVTQIAGHRLDEQWERRRNRHKTVKMDPETRYMSMAVLHDGTDVVFLALACSDGAVRLFTLAKDSKKIELLWETFYHQRCVLSVASYSLEDLHGKQHVLLFSGATDGAVALWDLTTVLDSKSKDSWDGPSTPCFSVLFHQSGVNTLVISEHHEDIIILASGGDDGQLSVMKIRVEFSQPETGSVCPQVLSHWSVPLAHSAPLTALSALSSTQLVSTSPDQRVCVWRLCDDGLHHQGAMFSHTADASGVWAWRREGPESESGAYVVVCGQGLQLLKLTEREKEHGKETRARQKEEERLKVVFSDCFVRV